MLNTTDHLSECIIRITFFFAYLSESITLQMINGKRTIAFSFAIREQPRRIAVNRYRVLKSDKKILTYDEITTKQTIILRLLHLLSWNVFSLDECIPEYSVGNRRVDFNIRVGSRDSIFIEVKKPKEDLENQEGRCLIFYCFSCREEI